MRVVTKLICAAFLLSLAMPAQVLAQDEESLPNLATVWIMHPKDGKTAELMAAVAEHVAFRREQGDSREWNAYAPAIGDDVGVVGFRYCCLDWADEDAYAAEEAEKGLLAHWNANVDQYVARYEHYLTEVDFDDSHWNDEAGPWTYFGVTTWRVAPGKDGDFNAMKSKMSQMAKDGNWAGGQRYWSWTSRIGGTSAEALISPFKNYADMAPPEQTFYQFAVEQMGEDAANEMFGKFSKSTRGYEYTVWRHLPELSIRHGE